MKQQVNLINSRQQSMQKMVSRLSDSHSQNIKSVNSRKSRRSVSNSVSPHGKSKRVQMAEENCQSFIKNVVQNKSTENLLTASLSNNENSTQALYRQKKVDNYGTTQNTSRQPKENLMVAGRQLQPLYNRRHTVDNTNQQALNINNNKLNSTSQISEIKMKNDNQHNSHQSQDLMAHFL